MPELRRTKAASPRLCKLRLLQWPDDVRAKGDRLSSLFEESFGFPIQSRSPIQSGSIYFCLQRAPEVL
jgi:hypothetical protein